MLKVGILGSHGVGKSTLCYMLASYYKQKGFNIKIVQETVRSSPFPFNDGMTQETGLWVYHTHIKKELEAQARGVELCVCDRTALDSLVYLHAKHKPTPISLAIEENAIQWLTTYDLIVFVIPNPDYKVTEDASRPADQEFQDKINLAFLKYIERMPEEAKKKMITINANDIFTNFQMSRAVEIIDDLCKKTRSINKLEEILAKTS